MEAGWGFGAWVLQFTRGFSSKKTPFVAGVGVPESLGHLLSRLGRLAPKASVARGIAWWWGSPPVALACGKVTPGCKLDVACAGLIAVVYRFGGKGDEADGLEFGREGMGNGRGLGRRELGCGVGGCALRGYFLRRLCSIYWYMPRCEASWAASEKGG